MKKKRLRNIWQSEKKIIFYVLLRKSRCNGRMGKELYLRSLSACFKIFSMTDFLRDNRRRSPNFFGDLRKNKRGLFHIDRRIGRRSHGLRQSIVFSACIQLIIRFPATQRRRKVSGKYRCSRSARASL